MKPKLMVAPGLRWDPMLFSLPINVNTSHWCPSSSFLLPTAAPRTRRRCGKVYSPFQSSYWMWPAEKNYNDNLVHPSFFYCLHVYNSPCAFREKKKKKRHMLSQVNASQCHSYMWLMTRAELAPHHQEQSWLPKYYPPHKTNVVNM